MTLLRLVHPFAVRLVSRRLSVVALILALLFLFMAVRSLLVAWSELFRNLSPMASNNP